MAADSAAAPSVAPGRFAWAFWPACLALYLGMLLIYAPSTSYGHRALDDLSELRFVAGKSWLQLLGLDHFHHLRPIKNLVFWVASRGGEAELPLLRWGLLLLFCASGGVLQLLVTELTGSRWLGIATAAAWALHPSTANVVCWLSAANISICLFAILLYLRWGARLIDRAHASGGTWRPLLLSQLSLTFALLSYEVAVAAPVVLFAYQRTFTTRRIERPARILYGSSAFLAAMFLALQFLLPDAHPSYRSADQPAWLLSYGAARYLAEHALLWVTPAGRFGILLGEAPFAHLLADAACWLLAMGVAVLAFRFRRRATCAVFGLTWFALFMIPVGNLVPLGNTPIAMHYLYIPAVGLSLLLASALRAAGEILANLAQPLRRLPLRSALLCAWLATWMPESVRSVSAWQSDERLYLQTLANYPNELEPLVNLSSLYLAQHDYARARTFLDRARRLAPGNLAVLRDEVSLSLATDAPEAALSLLESRLSGRDDPEFLIKRAEILDRLGRFAEATAADEKAFSLTHDRDQRYLAGYHLIVDYLRTQRHTLATTMVERLTREYPEHATRELALARRLLIQ